MEDRVECRTPAEGRAGVTRIPRWKYDAVRAAIMRAVQAAGPEGLPFAQLTGQVAALLSPEVRERLGSVSWHTTTVKLNMETEGELARSTGRGPQRLFPGPAARPD
jgi:hypothetical protein